MRTALAQLGYRPTGESATQAQDRLTALSASEHRRVVSGAESRERLVLIQQRDMGPRAEGDRPRRR